MADVAIKRAVSLPGAAVRERLRAMDDSAVVAQFLGGEERAFRRASRTLSDAAIQFRLSDDR